MTFQKYIRAQAKNREQKLEAVKVLAEEAGEST